MAQRKIAILSNAPHSTTGYANQVRAMLPQLERLGYETAVIAFYGVEGGVLKAGNTRIYPRGQHPYGLDVADAHTTHFNNGPGGVLLSLMDSWVLDPSAFRSSRWCLPEHAQVKLANGSTKPIGEIVAKRERVALAGYENGQLVKTCIKAWHAIDSTESGEIVEIRTRSGKKLEVTAENDVAVMGKDGGLTWVPASCIKSDDVVYCYHSIPSSTEGIQDEPTKANHQSRAGSHRQASTAINTDGMGVFSRYRRRRGDDNHSASVQAQGTDPYSTAQDRRNEHQREVASLVGRESGHAGQWPNQAFEEWRYNFQAAASGVLRYSDLGLQGVSRPDGHRAVPDNQAGAGALRQGVYRKQNSTVGSDVQSAIHSGRARPLVEGASLEPERVAFVSHRGKPYPIVYDLTTETGNFIADGVLVHNCPLFPIDHEPCPPPIRDRVARAYARIVYSQFGLKMMEAEGLACYYAPHMVDTSVYKPKPKVVARQDTRLPNDAFIVGMVAANKGAPSRKCFQQQLQAFAEFHRRHPDTHLHLHTAKGVGVGAEAVNLPELVEYLGIADCTTFADPYAYFLGIPDEGVATVYNAFDVLTNVSMGEGFGIPIVEAQACGVPVVVGDWTAMGELCFAGWAINKGDADPFWTPLGAFQFVPRVGAIVEAYENAYKYAGDYKLKQTARKGALAYHTETVADTYWRPVLDDLFERIEAEDSAPTFADVAKAAV